jgi:4-aminobutyrate aminotransferase
MQITLDSVGERSRALIERDAKTLSPSYTREYPLVVDRAQGSELWDVDGRRYVDFMAGVAVHNVGHRHPRVEAAVKEQIEKFWHICLSDFYYPQAVELAEMLQDIAPMSGETLIYFGNSGAEAVEAAIKLAMHNTGRHRFIGFHGAFHGRTLGALSFTASKYVQRAGYSAQRPRSPSALSQPLPAGARRRPGEDYGDTVLRYLEHDFFRTTVAPATSPPSSSSRFREKAATSCRPPASSGGCGKSVTEHGILLIVDEIQSGAGRTGRWWAVEHEGVEPDIVCFAKGVTSGMPIGGIVARKELMSWPSGSHGSTFGGNPVAAVAALETLRVIDDEGLLERATETGNLVIPTVFARHGCEHPSIGDVRGRGLMLGAEFVRDRTTKERAVALRNEIVQIAFRNGLLLLPCGANAVRFTPPLNVPLLLVDEGLSIFEDALPRPRHATSDARRRDEELCKIRYRSSWTPRRGRPAGNGNASARRRLHRSY